MSWQVHWSERSQHDLRRLDTVAARRVIETVDRLAATGYGDTKRLKGADGECRLRVGDWRVRFVFDYPARTIHVLRVLPRGRAFR